jgi:chromosomal replication initiation ATPase DnaA
MDRTVTDQEVKKHLKKLNGYEYSLLSNICDQTKVSINNLVSQIRKPEFVNARKMAVYFLLKKGYKLETAGEVISIIPKDHTSVIHLNKKAHDHYRFEPNFKNMIDNIDIMTSTTNFTSLKYRKI